MSPHLSLLLIILSTRVTDRLEITSMANVLLFTTNISLYTIPVAWLTCIGPHIQAIKLYEHLTGAPSRDFSRFKPEANAAESASGSTPREDEDYRFDKTQPRTFLSLIDRNPHPAMTPGVKARLTKQRVGTGMRILGCSALLSSLPILDSFLSWRGQVVEVLPRRDTMCGG